MSAVAGALPGTERRLRTGAVVRSLARAESRRMLRNPVLWACAALSVWMMWSVVPTPGEWPGASYEEMATCVAPLLFAVSVVVAFSFSRERLEVAPGAPVPEAQRTAGRLAAALPLLLVAAGYAALLAWRQRDLGGLWLGTEPGRTTQALFTTGELAQPVVLALLAVATGAALGRRLPLVAALPLLFLLWFVVSIYWLFGDAALTPFSILQVQPVRVLAGPPSADPLEFPGHWLLEAPGEFSDQWSRVFVSAALSWSHAAWLLGLSALWGAVVVPRGRGRRRLVTAGSLLAVVGLVAQYWVIP
jgi:hypothetical protein